MRFDASLAAAARVECNRGILLRLNTLRPVPGSRKKAHRIGRGQGSGRGKTSTRGQKGRTARQGGSVPLGYEGGQVPYYKAFKKHGFTNKKFKREYAPVSLAKLQFWIDTGRLDPAKTITMKTLIDSGCAGKLRKRQVGVKLLGDGADWFKTPVHIQVSQASLRALEAIKRAGGTIKLVYYNRVGLRALLKPHKYEPYTDRALPYLPPPPKHVIKKLVRPMEQPEQFQGWVQAQRLLQAKEAERTASL